MAELVYQPFGFVLDIYMHGFENPSFPPNIIWKLRTYLDETADNLSTTLTDEQRGEVVNLLKDKTLAEVATEEVLAPVDYNQVAVVWWKIYRGNIDPEDF